jgi:hypothetical protein
MAEVGGAVAVDFESERFSYLLDNSRFSYLLDPKGFCIFGSLELLAGTVPAGVGFREVPEVVRSVGIDDDRQTNGNHS